jgi:hypothetical protein
MKKSVKLACHVVNSNFAIGTLPTLQIPLGIVALCWRADSYRLFKYRGGCTKKYRCFKLGVCGVKRVSQPDTIALLGNNYSFQMIETRFAEQF